MTEDQATKILRGKGLRVTPPRLAVLRVLAQSAIPLSHGEVVEELSSEDWDPATVYRNLVKLREAGIAPVVSRAEGIDRYAYAEAPDDGHHHPHFYCEDCGRLACLPAEVSISLPVDNPWAASVRAAMVQLHGACPDCRG